jgi:hypothetical protein
MIRSDIPKLQRAIERFHHAEKWKAYLDIMRDTNAAADVSLSSQELRIVKSRFDIVAQDEKYTPLTSMEIFKRTRDQLSNYLSQFGDDSN